MISGIASCFFSVRKSTGGYSVAMWRGVGARERAAQKVAPAESPHLDREPGADDPVHGGGDDRQLEAMAAELPGDVHFVRVDRHRAWHEGNVIEPVRDPRLPSPSDPHPHRRSSPQPVAGALPPIPVYRDRPRARILYFV